MIEFSQLIEHYPLEDKNTLFNEVLGAGWPSLIDNPNYNNTCVIRISVMLNRIGQGYKINQEAGVSDGKHKDKNGNYILIRVNKGYQYLKQLFGNEYWGISKQPGSLMVLDQIKSLKGILIYHAQFSNANGHIDLWNAGECYNNCPVPDTNLAFEVGFWQF